MIADDQTHADGNMSTVTLHKLGTIGDRRYASVMGRGQTPSRLPAQQLLFGPRATSIRSTVDEPLLVTTAQGATFHITLVQSGQTYANGAIHVDPQGRGPLVAFTDVTRPEMPQPVAQYYLRTLRDHQGKLDLHGGIRQWTIDEQTMISIGQWMRRQSLQTRSPGPGL
jgi:hypothetical protein